MIAWVRSWFVQTITFGRSNRWPSVRNAWLKMNPTCAVCGNRYGNDVHHIKPYHLYPDEELAASNLVTLCPRDHFVFGHLCDWRAYNPDVLKDASDWRAKIASRAVK